jgi:hypothetical protein
MRITQPDGAEVSETVVLKAYFGLKEGQTAATFLAETKALAPEAKTELAGLAARELGYVVS